MADAEGVNWFAKMSKLGEKATGVRAGSDLFYWVMGPLQTGFARSLGRPLSAVVILYVYLCVSLPPKHMTRCCLPTAGKTPPRGLDGVRQPREGGGGGEQEEKLPKDPRGQPPLLTGIGGGGRQEELRCQARSLGCIVSLFPGDLVLAAHPNCWELGELESKACHGHQVGERPACLAYPKKLCWRFSWGCSAFLLGTPSPRHVWLCRRLSGKAGKSPGIAAGLLDGTDAECIQQPLEGGLDGIQIPLVFQALLILTRRRLAAA